MAGERVLELPEELAARLVEEARRRHVTPAELLGRALDALAEADGAEVPLWEELVALGEKAKQEDGTPGPVDLAAQVDHYAYGTPKR
jgi:hypothetical protein